MEYDWTVFEHCLFAVHAIKRFVAHFFFIVKYKHCFDFTSEPHWHIPQGTRALYVIYDLTTEQKQWLTENVGEKGIAWDFFSEKLNWHRGVSAKIGFKDADSAAAFKLRWCS